LGKRVAIASIKGTCAEDLADPSDQARIKDFDLIWIDDLLQKLELRHDPHQLECESPSHRGNRKVWTTFYPRRNQRFYCDECKAQYERQKQEQERPHTQGQTGTPPATQDQVSGETIGQVVLGQLREPKVGPNGPFAFMRTGVGNEYYFNPTHLEGTLSWDELKPDMPLRAEIVRLPAGGKAGAVRRVMDVAPQTAGQATGEQQIAEQPPAN
jgi:hypothetical protein